MRMSMSILLVSAFLLSCHSTALAGGSLPFPNPYRGGFNESDPYWKMDFEGGSCKDYLAGIYPVTPNPFYRCVAVNGANPDCQTGTAGPITPFCPLEGNRSGDIKGDEQIRMAQYYPSSNGNFTLDFLLRLVSASASVGPPYNSVGGFFDGNNNRCKLAFNYISSNAANVYTNGSGNPGTITVGTVYRVRIKWFASYGGICNVKVSTVAANNWDSGNILNSAVQPGGSSSHNNVGFLIQGGTTSDSNRFIIDDVVLCKGGSTATTQCDGT